MKILGILHDFRIFFIGKGSFNRILRKARKISNNIWPGKLMTIFYFFFHKKKSLLIFLLHLNKTIQVTQVLFKRLGLETTQTGPKNLSHINSIDPQNL